MRPMAGVITGVTLCFLCCAEIARGSIYVIDAPIAGSGNVKRVGPDGSVSPFFAGKIPQGLAAMPGGVYVTDVGFNSVFGFSSSATPPAMGTALASGLNSPGTLTADLASGSLYLTNGSTQILRITSAGSTGVFATATDIIHGMAVDRRGSVFVGETGTVEDEEGNFVDVGHIERLTSQGVWSTFYQSDALTPFLKSPGAMAFDASGTLFVADRDGSTIDRITSAGDASVFYTAATGHSITGMTFDADGTLYASILSDRKIIAFAAGSATPTDFATTDLTSPSALAADPPLPLPEPTALGPLCVAAHLLVRRRRIRS